MRPWVFGEPDIREGVAVEIHRGPRHVVARAQDLRGHYQILKTVAPGARSPAAIKRLRHEYDILSMLAAQALPNVAVPIGLREHRGGPTLVLADAGPLTLEDWLRQRPLSLERFWQVAIQLTEILCQVHRLRVIHRDINPSNVVVSAAGDRLVLIDFQAAASLGADHDEPEARLPGQLGTIAPEQLGQLRREVDQRADLYSLGATLYQALTGAPPFLCDDEAELVHAHLARIPVAPSARNPEVPDLLSSIILRLLAKMPEQRYQSAAALLADLREAARRWEAARTIEPFELDALDRVGTLPYGRIYGREAELNELVAAAARARAGTSEVVVCWGPAGIGKSCLIEALPLRLPEGTWFLSGRCDPLGGNIPYAPFLAAFRALAQKLAQLSPEETSRWRAQLHATLGANLGTIVEAVPALRPVLGDVPMVRTSDARASVSRFRLAFDVLLGAIAELGRPLVLFLDDMQWADPDSVALMQRMLAAGEHRLLLIASYRADEVTPGSPLAAVLAASGAGTAPRALPLGPLGLGALTELCADLFACPQERAQPFAELVLKKTAGNPFFTQRFLNHLQNEGLLTFDPARGAWSWDLAHAAAAKATDNVVDMMIEQIARQPAETRALLEIGACVRGPIDPALLAAVARTPAGEVVRRLGPALRDGLLVPVVGGEPGRGLGAYAFAHERISATVLERVGATERQRLHLQIGRQLLAARAAGPGEAPAEQIFDLAEQLDRGGALIVDLAERVRVAAIDLEAAEAAKHAGSLVPALAYARRGIALLPQDPPEAAWRQGELCGALHRVAAECAFFTGETASATELFDAALAHAASVNEQVELHALRAGIESGRGNLADALAWGRQGLSLIGLELPADSGAAIAGELARARAALAAAGPLAELLALPPMREPRSLAAMTVYQRMVLPARLVDEPLAALLAARMVVLSLEHGAGPATAYACVNLGIRLSNEPGGEDFGEALARVGLELARARRDPQIESWVLTTFAVLSNQWRVSWRAHVPLLRRAVAAALESGDFQMAGFALVSLGAFMFHSGAELALVSAECASSLRLMRKSGLEVAVTSPRLYQETVMRLQGRAARAAPARSEPEASHPAVLLAAVYLRDLGSLPARLPGLLARWQVDAALQHTFGLAWATFYAALAAVQILDAGTTEDRESMQGALLGCQQRLQGWAERCPQNFRHRADLVGAEIARLEGRTAEALLLYDRAIEAASRERFVHEEALAHELAARCRITAGLARSAADSLLSAREGYVRWGAVAKVAALDEEFPEIASVKRAFGLSSGKVISLDGAPANLELLSLLKAAETLSSEVELDRLLEKLIAVSLEVAGARRGALVLDEGAGLVVRAVGEVAAPVALGRTALAVSEQMPRSLIEYVFRSRETVALADAAKQGSFAEDPYIQSTQARSILAVPIVRQQTTLGVLYLENDLASYGFSLEKVRIVTLLTSQIAISLENGRLFDGLRAEITERTRAERRNRFLAEASAVLAQSLDYHTTLAQAARLALPVLADWCTIDVLERGGELTPVAAAHIDPGKEPLLAELRKAFPVVELERLPAYLAIQRGEPVVDSDVSESRLADHISEPRHRELLREIGLRSYVAVPLIARGHVLGAITFGSASAARPQGPQEVALAQELAQRAAILIDNARLYQAAQEAVRVRDDFLIVASHELNTPITSLRLAASSFAPGGTPPDPAAVARVIGVVDRQSARLATLVGEMLDVSRLKGAGLRLRLEKLDLGALIAEICEGLRADLERVGCRLTLALARGVLGNFDRVAVERVLTNLLSNAMKFGAGQPVDVGLAVEDGVARISVRDRGIGIAPEHLPQIFERFGRGVSVEHYGGLGLGLYIVHEVVTSLGGMVDVASRPGEGATFSVTLPLR